MLGNSSRILRLRIEPMSQQEMCWTNCLLEVAIKFILSLSFSIHKLRCVLNTSISYLPLHNAKHYFLLLLHIIIWLGDLSKGKHKCYPLPPQQCLLNFFLYSQLCVCVLSGPKCMRYKGEGRLCVEEEVRNQTPPQSRTIRLRLLQIVHQDLCRVCKKHSIRFI